MNYDYETALTEAMERVMNKINRKLDNMSNWFIHDYLFFHSNIPYEEVRAMEYRAFGCIGWH